MKYGKGYIRDPEHRRTQQSAKLLCGAHVGSLPLSVSLRPFELAPFDQGSTSSCAGHAAAMATAMALAAQGKPLSFTPSPLDIYRVARCIARIGKNEPLTDSGSQLSDVMSAVSEWGVRPIGPLMNGRNTDADPAVINDAPELFDLERDSNCVIAGEYRIEETASDAVWQAQTILAQNIPVVVGGPVDEAYEEWQPGLPACGPAGPDGAGHAQVIVGYTTLPDNSVVFDVLSSWGEWADSGHARVTSEWVRSQWDLIVWTVRQKS